MPELNYRNLELMEVPIDAVNLEPASTDETQQQSLLEQSQRYPVHLRAVKSRAKKKTTVKFDGEAYRFDIINGRRRLVDLVAIGTDTVLAMVEFDVPDVDLHLMALIANAGKPNEMDEALHIQSLMRDGWEQKTIAEAVGYSPATVTQRLKLLKLVPPLQDQLRVKTINVTTALTLSELPEMKQKLVSEAAEESGKPVSTKAAREAVREHQSGLVQLETLDLPEPVEAGEFEHAPGLFLPGEVMELLADGESVDVEWAGQPVTLSMTHG